MIHKDQLNFLRSDSPTILTNFLMLMVGFMPIPDLLIQTFLYINKEYINMLIIIRVEPFDCLPY